MIPYYEELNDEEKNAVTKVIRTLLKQTFVLERKYDKKSGRLVYNKEFRTIDLHQEFLREYFKISGIELRENLHLGVFYIEGETLIGEKISRLSPISTFNSSATVCAILFAKLLLISSFRPGHSFTITCGIFSPSQSNEIYHYQPYPFLRLPEYNNPATHISNLSIL